MRRSTSVSGWRRRGRRRAIYRHPRTFPLDPETGQITGGQAHVALAVAAMRVVVEVDVDLGLTRVVWIGTAQDVGKALSRTAVEGRSRAAPHRARARASWRRSRRATG